MSGPTTTPERLKRGAAILGDLWRKGIRCAEEMNVLCPEADPNKAMDCFCDPKTPFCKAKKQWLDMAAESGRELVQGEYGLIESMGGSEWDATALTVKFEFPGVGVHGIGPKGIMGREDIVQLFESPETLSAIVGMMKKFTGLKVQEVIPAKPKDVSVEIEREEEVEKEKSTTPP